MKDCQISKIGDFTFFQCGKSSRPTKKVQVQVDTKLFEKFAEKMKCNDLKIDVVFTEFVHWFLKEEDMGRFL